MRRRSTWAPPTRSPSRRAAYLLARKPATARTRAHTDSWVTSVPGVPVTSWSQAASCSGPGWASSSTVTAPPVGTSRGLVPVIGPPRADGTFGSAAPGDARPYDRSGRGALRGVTVTTRLRHDLGRAAVLLAGALLLTACVGGGASPAPTPSAPGAAGPSAAPSGCTATVTTEDEAARVLAVAVAGSTVCATGDGLRDADLVVRGSGTQDRPVVL